MHTLIHIDHPFMTEPCAIAAEIAQTARRLAKKAMVLEPMTMMVVTAGGQPAKKIDVR